MTTLEASVSERELARRKADQLLQLFPFLPPVIATKLADAGITQKRMGIRLAYDWLAAYGAEQITRLEHTCANRKRLSELRLEYTLAFQTGNQPDLLLCQLWYLQLKQMLPPTNPLYQ